MITMRGPLVTLLLTTAVGFTGFAACGTGQDDSRLLETIEHESSLLELETIIETLDYLESTLMYKLAVLQVIQLASTIGMLEWEGTMEQQPERLQNFLADVRSQKAYFKLVSAPALAARYRTLEVRAFDATEQALAAMIYTFEQALQPARSQRDWAERFQEGNAEAETMVAEAISKFGEASVERTKLINYLEERTLQLSK